MILRLSDSLSRGLVLFASLVLAGTLSYYGIRTAVAQVASEGQTSKELERAIRLEPKNAEYWFRLGHFQQFNLEDPDSTKAAASFQKAISLLPSYTDAWVELATTDELNGQAAEAREAYVKAKQSYPSSADVAWRYGNFLLREGELPEAFEELRRALQADPLRAAATFSRVYRADPDIDAILENVLPATKPVYVDVITEAAGSGQLAVARTVWGRLLDLHPELGIRDFDPLLSRLIEAKDDDAALRVWEQGTSRMNLPPLLQPQGSVVWDPSFESGISGRGFAWNFLPLAQGVQTEFDTTEKLTGNKSLRLSFDGKHNPSLDVACSMGIVEPGRQYLFSGWIKTKDLTTEQGVRFHIQGTGVPNTALTATRELHGTNPWTFVERSWTAEPGVHRVRICVSREPSDNPDVRISGTAWIEDVNLAPKPMEHPRP
jgi:tetratricopeptide (TPR) repeat protein